MIYLFGSLLKKLIVISELRKTMMDLFTDLFVLKTMLNYDEQKHMDRLYVIKLWILILFVDG